MNNINPSISISNPEPVGVNLIQKLGLALLGTGLLGLFITPFALNVIAPAILFLLVFGFIVAGSITYILNTYLTQSPGVKNNYVWFNSLTSRGTAGWILGIMMTGFYVILYFYPWLLDGFIKLFDPASNFIRNQPADRWFLYSFIYTLSVLIMGTYAIFKYRFSNYQIVRTLSVMFFQFGFAFLIPHMLTALNQPEFYFTYFWPLKYEYLFPDKMSELLVHPGGLGAFMVFWGVVMTVIATPILTYFFGKRWYCSWVCGCGGLANTAGDPFRQLSDKSLKAWRIERFTIYAVLVITIVTTSVLWINSYTQGGILGDLSAGFSKWYGFFIGAIFAGVIGVGFYPIMGTRVWCRFGCPMAAILGIQQRFFSRFRISTNGGQCISCGNCSTYCEMGIDVRWYAQRGQNIVRASCVGCGMCSAVCPRGVLNLENGPVKERINESPVLIGNKNLLYKCKRS